MENRFGAVSAETQIIHGRWSSDGKAFRDDLIRVYVDAEQTAEVQAFFLEFKQQTKARFRQMNIWLVSHVIDVL